MKEKLSAGKQFERDLINLCLRASREMKIRKSDAFSRASCWCYRSCSRLAEGRNIYTGEKQKGSR